MESIISAIFKEESKGYQAITELRKEPVGDGLVVSQAVLAKKERGMINVLDSFDTGLASADDTFTGGLVGGLIGILGGPLGVLLGGSIGSLVGSAMDVDDAVGRSSLIEKVMEMFQDGEVALVALVQEDVEGALDRAIAMVDPEIIKLDAAEVAEEIRQAKELQKEMEKEARQRIREQKQKEISDEIEKNRQKIKANFEEIKEKFANKG